MDWFRHCLRLSRIIKQLEPGYRLQFHAHFAKAAAKSKSPQKGGKPAKKRTAAEAQAALKAKADPPDEPTPMSPLLKASLARQDLKKPKQSPEELKASEAAAKEYSRRMMHELRQKQFALQQRIQLKWDAIAALPEGYLRDEASKEDLSPFPPRRLPTWTPPIPGFSNRDDASAKDADRRRR